MSCTSTQFQNVVALNAILSTDWNKWYVHWFCIRSRINAACDNAYGFDCNLVANKNIDRCFPFMHVTFDYIYEKSRDLDINTTDLFGLSYNKKAFVETIDRSWNEILRDTMS